MRDFPVFDTQNGVGSLILKEIPYRGIAYIRIQAASDPAAFLAECVDFCKMAGAKRILATGHDCLAQYPPYTQIWKMTIHADSLPDTDAAVFPVTEKTAARWQELYNEKMKNVPNSAYMTSRDMQKMLTEGDGYFVHRNGNLLGLGKAAGDRIDAVISMEKGAGKTVVAALAHALSEEIISLQVASANEKAVRLYDTLGFIKNEIVSTWFTIL